MLKQNYEKRLKELLNDENINTSNRRIFKTFFKEKEAKLMRTNGFLELDEGCYKTLLGYINRLQNVNMWFKNKDWNHITKSDIKKVFHELETGVIKNHQGKQFQDRGSFYNKIFKSRPFEIAGLYEHACDVLREGFHVPQKEVRYLDVDDFPKINNLISNPEHKCLLWLAWDIGENIEALLDLKRNDFTKEIDKDTARSRYHVNLRKVILKRTRRSRGISTLFDETNDLLDIVLKNKKADDLVFDFGYSNAVKFLYRAADLANVKAKPLNKKLNWKDLRSGMTCRLLNQQWSVEELNCRLGHKPSSNEIDKYVNFLSMGERTVRKKTDDHEISKLKYELEQFKQREQLYNSRVDNLTNVNKEIIANLQKKEDELSELQQSINKRFEEMEIEFKETFAEELERLKKEWDR